MDQILATPQKRSVEFVTPIHFRRARNFSRNTFNSALLGWVNKSYNHA